MVVCISSTSRGENVGVVTTTVWPGAKARNKPKAHARLLNSIFFSTMLLLRTCPSTTWKPC